MRGRFPVMVFISLLTTLPSLARGDVANGADEVAIHYSRAGTGRTALVFVHGWSCDRSYWSEQIGAFAADYTVVAIDLAGHGESGTDRSDWSMTSFGTDVAAVVEQEGLDEVVLVGHSMGGSVVLEAARQLGDRVALIVGVDTLQQPLAPPRSEVDSRALWARFAEDFPASTAGFVRRSFFLESSPPDLVDRIAEDMSAANPTVALEAGHQLTIYDIEAGIRANRDVPFVLINADYRPTDADGLRQLHPRARVALITGVGHFPMLETPAEFNELLDTVILTMLAP